FLELIIIRLFALKLLLIFLHLLCLTARDFFSQEVFQLAAWGFLALAGICGIAMMALALRYLARRYEI
ncbi:MAG: hypothetical protein HY391_06280, partial [Deltaproteobacteria bacterium]|nr:hypothetical protein [Deltaproteobacteria bacterium]